ncbi:hypothetical protein LOZ12_003670 [Ophidiomyces ophidiicola]|uniref:Uncharacterized protein n=1 Tax=Ophidiomyces ophidiicola TaxID=1387563 RepID=A0ACB8UW08_9EURO|nr:hypothetical protein LOZ59_004195 [Ophidiomyces ophidiicola]KAI2050804.1 hypothetical protein LOZ38_003035 [Ophidiomyces ophidiicola]KAI2079778.1 hypothetical protein LOZ37_001787 [Ophidiomyces ophidiicola]KAI2094575.1 hypothetical protein LOZ35_003676 [Ophidiomyces ophidiicola]KAI2107608.1 hypothetical protein LOZ34_002598 [Ophidiomyces ophidiicola]
MAPRLIDLKISAPLSNPALRNDRGSDGPNTTAFMPLSPIVNSNPRRVTHASYPPMHNSLPFDGTQRISYHSRLVSQNPQRATLTPSATMQPRRASTIKTVMRKLFGRKRKSDPVVQELDCEDNPNMANDPQAFSRLRNTEPEFLTIADAGKQSLKSVSSREHISHIPTPTEPELVDIPPVPAGNKDKEEDALATRRRRPRRRATLPSLVLSSEEGREIATKIARQGSRSVSIGSVAEQRTADNASRASGTQFKRRSRSAYALRELARSHRMSPIQWRRRSDEIRFLEKTLDPEDDSAPIRDTVVGDTSKEEEEAAAAAEEDPAEIRVEALAANGDLSQFDFGNLMSNMQEDCDASLTQRISTLEVKLMDLEFAIAKLQGSDLSPIQPFPPAPSKVTNSGPHVPVPPVMASEEPPSRDTTSVRPSTVDTQRPTSTATLRPHTAALQSHPPMSPSPFSSPGISVEQYSALTTLVRREQTARKLLEHQVQDLQREVELLRGLPGTRQDSVFPQSSCASESATSSRCDSRQERLDSGMWRLHSGSSIGKADAPSLESLPLKKDVSFHRKNTLDRMIVRT